MKVSDMTAIMKAVADVLSPHLDGIKASLQRRADEVSTLTDMVQELERRIARLEGGRNG